MNAIKPLSEYYDFGYELKENVFLTKVVQKYRYHLGQSENAYAYMSLQEKIRLLGNPTYKKRIEKLINIGAIREVIVGKNPNNSKQNIMGYIPADMKYKRKKAYLPFLDEYHLWLNSFLSPEALNIYNTMRNSNVDISDRQLQEALINSCNRKGYPDTQKYIDENKEIVREGIKDFNSNSSMYIVEDPFGNRVHTFVSGLHQEIRKNYLLINNNITVECDLHQSQMVIFGKLLEELYGSNSFSGVVKNEDVYMLFGLRNGIEDRGMAKKFMFRALFDRTGSKADLMFKEAFPDAYKFVENIKGICLLQNPSWKMYSNLSFMLQREESGIFRNLWKELMIERIPFLTAHDSIIVEYQFEEVAKIIMQRSLKEQIGDHIQVM